MLVLTGWYKVTSMLHQEFSRTMADTCAKLKDKDLTEDKLVLCLVTQQAVLHLTWNPHVIKMM